jgi:hypothetical protein
MLTIRLIWIIMLACVIGLATGSLVLSMGFLIVGDVFVIIITENEKRPRK